MLDTKDGYRVVRYFGENGPAFLLPTEAYSRYQRVWVIVGLAIPVCGALYFLHPLAGMLGLIAAMMVVTAQIGSLIRLDPRLKESARPDN